MRAAVPLTALKTPFRNVTVRDLALAALRISHQGPRRWQINDAVSRDDAVSRAAVSDRRSRVHPSRDLLCAYARRWDHSVASVFLEYGC